MELGSQIVWLFVAVGLVVAALAVPLMAGKVRQNSLYGLRIPATMKDPIVWYEANRVAGRYLGAVGVLTVALALLMHVVVGAPSPLTAGVCAAWLLVGVVVATVKSVRLANRLTRLRNGGGATR